MGRKWYDGTSGNWYVDNGTNERFEVWLNRKMFRIVEPNDFVVKRFGDNAFVFGHTLEIRTVSGAELDKCIFQFCPPLPMIDGRESLTGGGGDSHSFTTSIA